MIERIGVPKHSELNPHPSEPREGGFNVDLFVETGITSGRLGITLGERYESDFKISACINGVGISF